MSSTILAAEGLNPLIPHVEEIILGVVVFLILVFMIKKFVVPNFEKAYAERTAAIEGGMKEAGTGPGRGQGCAGAVQRPALRSPPRGCTHPRGSA